MRTVFVDAGYWIALLNPSDDLHHHAKAISNAMAPFNMITSEMVLTEVLNSFSRKDASFKKSTVGLIQDIRNDPTINVVSQSGELFRVAFELYRQRLDQAWSHTDCASFCIMQQRNITAALTHDRHFEQAGFVALLR